jgi:hypothetical protein
MNRAQRAPLGWPSDPAGDLREAHAMRRNMLRAALVAGMIAGFGCVIPFLPWIMLLMLACGGIAITIFHWRMPTESTPPSMGFRIGLLSGFFAWVTNATINLLLLIPPGNRALLQKQLHEKLAETISTAPDQASREMLQRVGEMIGSPSGLMSIFAIGMVILGVVFLLLGGLGGAIGATLFGKRHHQQ